MRLKCVIVNNSHLISGFVCRQLVAERDPGLPRLECTDDGRKRLLGVGDLVLEDGGDAIPENFQPPGRIGQQRAGEVGLQVLA